MLKRAIISAAFMLVGGLANADEIAGVGCMDTPDVHNRCTPHVQFDSIDKCQDWLNRVAGDRNNPRVTFADGIVTMALRPSGTLTFGCYTRSTPDWVPAQ